MPKPLPFLEEELDVFWHPEPFDTHLPSPGFITDFVTALRGRETPTITAAWSAIFALSSIMKRDSYLLQYPMKVYPNFFILIVGPPRLVSKSFAVNYADDFLLTTFHKEIEDIYYQKLKRLNILRSRATPEALTVALAPEMDTVVVNREVRDIDRGSQLVLIMSEIGTFLGRQKYNQGMVTKLLNLYDCKDADDDLTISRGNLPMRNVYVTLFGATTRDQLSKTITDDATGSGFISRLVIVHTDRPTRVFPEPKPVLLKDGGAVDWSLELRKRLAWVAQNSIGEYTLSPDAKEFWVEWYLAHHKALMRKIDSKETEMRSRLDVHLLKLAMIFRANRYDLGNRVELEDIRQARAFLNATYNDSYATLEDAIAPKDFNKWMNRVISLLRRHRKVKRTLLLRSLSPVGCRKDDVNLILRQLKEEYRINIHTPPGGTKFKDGNEVYEWRTGLQEGL